MDARNLFEHQITKFPGFDDRLKPKATTVESPIYEAALKKVQAGEVDKLIRVKQRFARRLLKVPNNEVSEATSSPQKRTSWPKDAIAEAREQRNRRSSKYTNLCFIFYTSSLRNRLLSIIGGALNDRQRSSLTSNLEMQIFFRVNIEY